jgi:penicillin-binding protein 2
LAHAIGGMAVGARWYQPHVVKPLSEDQEIPVRTANWSPENIRKVVGGTYAVVNEGGTGSRARLPGIPVCGKTGTSQVISNESLSKVANKDDFKDNGWYFGFAPCDAPEIIVVVLWEAGEAGSLAGPIVRDVLKAYFDKKERLEMTRNRQSPPETAANTSPTLPRQAPAVVRASDTRSAPVQ